MGSRPTHSSSARKVNSGKSPHRRPKLLGGEPNWMAIVKRIGRTLTQSPRGNLKTNVAGQSKQRLTYDGGKPRLFVLELSRGDMDKARLRIQGKLSLIRSTAAVVAEIVRRLERPDSDAAAVLEHLIIDPLTYQIADIGVLLGEKVEKDEGVGAS